MRCLVTGAAGFVGSHLVERLLDAGHVVLGVDCLVPYYSLDLKRRNLAPLLGRSDYSFVEGDLAEMDLAPLVRDVDWVFHQAAQAGVRASWGAGFGPYIRHNVTATQRLLEACTQRPPQAFVYASSSSVYGNTPLPMREDARPQPLSPYGMTKLAGEHLCTLYGQGFGIPTVSLRYFTVYGPRQRPDMGINRFIRALLRGEEIAVYGDGEQSRDFTYVADIVDANVRAAERIDRTAGGIFNVGGGSRITVNDLLALLGELTGRTPHLRYSAAQQGDVDHTGADCSRAADVLGFRPSHALRDGLARQIAWQRELEDRDRRIYLMPRPLAGSSAARPARHSAPTTPRILLYSHDTFGLGHLRRNLAIAGRLSHAFPGASLLLLSGSPVAQQFALPAGADIVKLPSVIKQGQEQYVAQGLRVRPAEILALRRGLILETVAAFKPDLLLVDHAPLGMRGELRPALEYLRANLPQSRAVLGLRDILDEPEAVRRTWREQGIYEVLETLYDRLVIYGVPAVCDPIVAYDLPPAIAARTRFCGYIRRDDPIAPAAEIRHALGLSDGEALVVVTAGGGGDGAQIEEAYLRALRAGPVSWRSVVVTGPLMPATEHARLEALCHGLASVRISRFERDLPSLMRAANVVVTMGGYNSLCEVTGSGARAVVIPRTMPRTEQLIRAQAFARLGLVDVLLPDAATPAGILAAVEAALARGKERRSASRVLGGGAVLQNGLDRLIPLLAEALPHVEVELLEEEEVLA